MSRKTLQQFLDSLSPEQRELALRRYVEAINNPPEPSEELKEMVRKYGRFAGLNDAEE